MVVSQKHKSGVTLMEVMAVVAIMGILSGLGVAGFQRAVANARIKDATFNVTAFMERTANETRRLSTKLCVKRVNDQKLVTYKSACNANPIGDKVDSLMFEAPTKLINSNITDARFKDEEGQNLTNWYTDGAPFVPRMGLSSAPSQGFFAVQYGGKDIYGAALKEKSKNSFTAMMGSDAGWSGI